MINPEKQSEQPKPEQEPKKGFDFDFPEIDKLAKEEKGREKKYTWLKQAEETGDILIKDIEGVEDVLDKLENNKIDEDEALGDRLIKAANNRWKQEKKSNKEANLEDRKSVV